MPSSRKLVKLEVSPRRIDTDRRTRHRHAALCLATAILVVGRLIDWRNRWSPT